MVLFSLLEKSVGLHVVTENYVHKYISIQDTY